MQVAEYTGTDYNISDSNNSPKIRGYIWSGSSDPTLKLFSRTMSLHLKIAIPQLVYLQTRQHRGHNILHKDKKLVKAFPEQTIYPRHSASRKKRKPPMPIQALRARKLVSTLNSLMFSPMIREICIFSIFF